MTTQLHCAQCSAELTQDDIDFNSCERDLSYPGFWEPDSWVCYDCFMRDEIEASRH